MSTSGPNVLNILKNKIQTLRDNQDATSDALEEKIAAVKLEEERRHEAEAEVNNLKNKIALMEMKKMDSEKRLNVITKSLAEKSVQADQVEKSRITLETQQCSVEDQIDSLEQMLREATQNRDEMQCRYDEVARRLLVAESELRRTEERAGRAESKAQSLEEQLQSAAQRLRSLEVMENANTSREDDDDEVIHALQQKIMQAEERFEIAQRECVRRQKELDQTEETLLETKLKIQTTKEELDSCLYQIQDL